MKKFLHQAKIVQAAVGALLVGTLAGCSAGGDSSLTLKGVVETDILSHYSEVSGKIKAMPVMLGQRVSSGEVIALIDDTAERYALEQLEAGLTQKKAALADLLNTADPADVRQGENNVSIAAQSVSRAQIAYQRAQQDDEANRQLFASGAIAEKTLNDAQDKAALAAQDLTIAQSQLDNARQKLVLLQQAPDAAKITQSQANITLTESQIRQAEEQLRKYQITALADGTVISLSYSLGAMVTPGSNLADLADDTEKYIVAYLPEDNLALISYGQEVSVRSGGAVYQGAVAFIDLQAQYTPKDMQTAVNKDKNSMKIKVRLSADNPLKVGEKAEVVLGKN
ncbi:MAG: HlyD family efflux transporter periplasmic adaptor subunit [Peptococcaceae bacterium]|jgi:HlyD family secretion protein|nr:HlyD family efflux transporter periplasmic adaptor subunit [Peptococcaceae bacterium]